MNNKHGYIALSTVLVIGAVVTLVGTSVTLLTISDAQTALGEKRKEEAIHFVESCIEDILLVLNEENTIPTPTVVLPEGTCTVTIDSQVGNSWTFTVTGTQNQHTKTIQVSATRGSTVDITRWKEL